MTKKIALGLLLGLIGLLAYFAATNNKPKDGPLYGIPNVTWHIPRPPNGADSIEPQKYDRRVTEIAAAESAKIPLVTTRRWKADK